jgi:hypothetical protein
MTDLSEEEQMLVMKLAPVLENSLRYKIIRSIIDALEEQTYPPEDMLQEDFIRSVEEAEAEIKEGRSRRYSREEFKREFLVEVD